MAHIIISYRRADSDAISGRIRDRLALHFGDDSIFMDIDSIPFGVDFREHIQQALALNDVLIAVIGPKWLGPGKGERLRIMELTDPVRIEIETALKHGSVIIPVLVGDAAMPEPVDLPDTLKDLAFRNAAQVDAGRDFNQHMERLIRSIEFILTSRGKNKSAAAAGAPAAGVRPGETSQPIYAAAPIPAAPVAPPYVPPPAPAAGSAPPMAPHAAMGTGAAQSGDKPHTGSSLWRWLAAGVGAIVLAAGTAAGTWYVLNRPDEEASKKQVVKEEEVTRPSSPIGPVVAAGCKLPVQATLVDDFRNVDPSWSLPAQTAYYVDGQLALKGMEGRISRVLYPPLRFKNPTICAIVQSPLDLQALDGLTNGGVMFWATDVSNFYVASVYANGTYSIFRMANDSWAAVAQRAPFDAIRTGAGIINEVQVVTKDNVGTLFVNGVKVQEFRGQPPKDPSMVGLYGASSTNERNEWRARYVAVVDPADPPPAAPAPRALAPQVGPGCKPSRAAAFADNFRSVDPGWGIVANTPASIKDGQFVLRPNINKGWQQLYPSLFFKSATMCVQVKSPPQATDPDGNQNGGLVFWAVNRSNYYTADVYSNGRFGIYRMVGDAWATVVSPRKLDAVKTGPNAMNDIMVSFSGDRAVFFVNGQKAHEFRGQPPRIGGSIGLFAASEKEQENEWRFSNFVVVEND